MMRATAFLAFLSLATAACAGGDDVDPGDQPVDGSDAAAQSGAVGENPGLPTEETEFQPTSWSTEPGVEGIGGRLWVSTASTVDTEGFSVVAQVEGLPEGSYSWALHRGACSERDELLTGLGYGAVADQRGRGEEVANGGGPLGGMPRVFRPTAGNAEEVVFVPLGERLSRAELERGTHSVRLHPNVEGEDPGPSVACAPVPPLPRPGDAAGDTAG